MNTARRGTILIIAAGISALLAGLALTFILRMSSDVEESTYVVQYAQAKLMLAAGMNYVQESSRLGWDRDYPSAIPGSSPSSRLPRFDTDNGNLATIDGLIVHEESYGWIDVRDGQTGPCNRFGQPMFANLKDGTTWPCVGSAVRCPMYVMKRPPYATRLNTGFNIIKTTVPISDPTYGQPLLINPDPQPVVDNNWSFPSPSGVSSTKYVDFKAGDRTPVVGTTDMSWFRVYRDGPSTFIITCGVGATGGFKNWKEVQDALKEDFFNRDRVFFESLRNSELRLWYRIEWSAHVADNGYNALSWQKGLNQMEHYLSVAPNAQSNVGSYTQTWMRNPVGTIRWIQRLIKEPSFW